MQTMASGLVKEPTNDSPKGSLAWEVWKAASTSAPSSHPAPTQHDCSAHCLDITSGITLSIPLPVCQLAVREKLSGDLKGF